MRALVIVTLAVLALIAIGKPVRIERRSSATPLEALNNYDFVISIVGKKDLETFNCVGSLISKQWVLTSASCMNEDPEIVWTVFGNSLYQTIEDATAANAPAPVVRSITEIYAMGNRGTSVLTNNEPNLALLRLNEAITRTTRINLDSPTPEGEDSQSAWISGEEGTSVSYNGGMLAADSSDQMASDDSTCTGLPGYSQSLHRCISNGPDFTSVDSGAPFVSTHLLDNKWRLTGVVGIVTGSTDTVIVQRVDTAEASDWIKSIAGVEAKDTEEIIYRMKVFDVQAGPCKVGLWSMKNVAGEIFANAYPSIASNVNGTGMNSPACGCAAPPIGGTGTPSISLFIASNSERILEFGDLHELQTVFEGFSLSTMSSGILSSESAYDSRIYVDGNIKIINTVTLETLLEFTSAQLSLTMSYDPVKIQSTGSLKAVVADTSKPTLRDELSSSDNRVVTFDIISFDGLENDCYGTFDFDLALRSNSGGGGDPDTDITPSVATLELVSVSSVDHIYKAEHAFDKDLNTAWRSDGPSNAQISFKNKMEGSLVFNKFSLVQDTKGRIRNFRLLSSINNGLTFNVIYTGVVPQNDGQNYMAVFNNFITADELRLEVDESWSNGKYIGLLEIVIETVDIDPDSTEPLTPELPATDSFSPNGLTFSSEEPGYPGVFGADGNADTFWRSEAPVEAWFILDSRNIDSKDTVTLIRDHKNRIKDLALYAWIDGTWEHLNNYVLLNVKGEWTATFPAVASARWFKLVFMESYRPKKYIGFADVRVCAGGKSCYLGDIPDDVSIGASSSEPNFGAALATDGDKETYWKASSNANEYLVWDSHNSAEKNHLSIHRGNLKMLKDFNIQYYDNDDEDWVTSISFNNLSIDSMENIEKEIDATLHRFWRISVASSHGSKFIGVAEIAVCDTSASKSCFDPPDVLPPEPSLPPLPEGLDSIIVSATEAAKGSSISYANDHDRLTAYISSTPVNATLVFDLGELASVISANIARESKRIRNFELHSSDIPHGNYTLRYTGEAKLERDDIRITLGQIVARYWKLVILNTYGPGKFCGIRDISFIGSASP